MPAKLYPQGIIETHAELEKDGPYTLHLMIGGENAIAEEDILKIPFNIGIDPDAKSTWDRIPTIIGIILGVMTPFIIGVIILSPILPTNKWTHQLSKVKSLCHKTRVLRVKSKLA